MSNQLPEQPKNSPRPWKAFGACFLACILTLGAGQAALAQDGGQCEAHPLENRFTGLRGEHSSITEGDVILSVPRDFDSH